MKYVAHLQRYSWRRAGQGKCEKKRVVVDGKDFMDAYFNVVPTLFPDWQISMFWEETSLKIFSGNPLTLPTE
jgi:hypothetical protein